MGMCSALTSRDDVLPLRLLLLLRRDVGEDVFLRRPQPIFLLLLLPLLVDLLASLLDALLPVVRVLLIRVLKKDGRRCVLLRRHVAASLWPSLLAPLLAFIVVDADDDFDLIRLLVATLHLTWPLTKSRSRKISYNVRMKGCRIRS